MTFELENVRQQLTKVLAVNENLWIDKQALRLSLEHVYKVAADEIQNIETEASSFASNAPSAGGRGVALTGNFHIIFH
jgi:hypothetical protein